MSDFSLYKLYQLQAIESVLDPSEEAHYRRICRWYSSTFHTPLIQVLTLPTEHILSNYYESTMEGVSHNDLVDIVIKDFLPEIAKDLKEQEDMSDQELEKEQAMTLAKKEGKIQPEPQSLSQGPVSQSSQPEDVNMTFEDENPDL